jgi:hypothetical protein
MEGLIFQWMPAPYQYIPDNRSTFCVELDDPTTADTEEIQPALLNRTRAAVCRPPLGPSAAQHRRRLTLAGRVVVELCRHEHTFTCFTVRPTSFRLTLPSCMPVGVDARFGQHQCTGAEAAPGSRAVCARPRACLTHPRSDLRTGGPYPK